MKSMTRLATSMLAAAALLAVPASVDAWQQGQGTVGTV